VFVLSENLKRVLKERKMTISSLAKGSHVPKTSIHGWIKDGANPNLVQLGKVADYLELSIEYLAFGIEQKQEVIEEIEIFGGRYELCINIKKINKKNVP